jgi:hypothetical protein
MVIHDFYSVGCPVSPDEANAPLVVDPYAVLPLPVAFKRFEAVGGRNAQVVKTGNGVEHVEFAQGDAGEGDESAGWSSFEESPCVLAPE